MGLANQGGDFDVGSCLLVMTLGRGFGAKRLYRVKFILIGPCLSFGGVI